MHIAYRFLQDLLSSNCMNYMLKFRIMDINECINFQLSSKYEQLFQSISKIEADISVLDMHSLTDMVDHIQLILKTLIVFDKETAQLKKDVQVIEGNEPELLKKVELIENKLMQLTGRSEKALRIVEVWSIYLFLCHNKIINTIIF